MLRSGLIIRLKDAFKEKMDFTASYTVQHEDVPTEKSIAYREIWEKDLAFGASVCKILNN